MIGNLEGFIIEPGNYGPSNGGPTNGHLTVFRRANEPRHAYEVEITSRRIAVHQFHPADVEDGDAIADAKRYVPALRKAARKFRRQTFTGRRRGVDAVLAGNGVETPIRDDMRMAFRDLIAKSNAREHAADWERKRLTEGRRDFEQAFWRATEGIIVPTLDAIANLLRRAGWRCDIVPLLPGLGVSFAVYRGTMTAVGESGRPRIVFATAPRRPALEVTVFTQTIGGGCHEYGLGNVSNDFVVDQVLLFFRRLTTEALPVP